jgi:prepilin-type N-terminal cleavage/methylation domain-containing protein
MTMTMKKKGFTLVELLVVIAIIGLLSSIAVVSLGSARTKARDAKRVADVKQMITAFEQYYSDNSGYPYATPTGTTGGQMIGGTQICTTATTGLSFTGTCTSTYMGSIPTYPTPGLSGVSATCSTTAFASLAATDARANYCYFTSTAGGVQTSYKLMFGLEAANSNFGSTTNCTASPSGITC